MEGMTRIIPARPQMPSDEVIQAKVDHKRSMLAAIDFGGELWREQNRTRLYVCDKRGFVQSRYPEPDSSGAKTIGLKAFMEIPNDPQRPA